jgi:hypothetical protein
MHGAIGQALQSPQWILNGPNFMGQMELDAVEDARQSLIQAHKPVTEPRLVAELRLGFWTSLADRRYDRLWPKIIKTAFPSMPNGIRTRNEISSRINGVRRLRSSTITPFGTPAISSSNTLTATPSSSGYPRPSAH